MRPFRRLIVVTATMIGGFWVWAKDPVPASGKVLLAYARGLQLEMLIGQYDPARERWLPNTEPFVPPFILAPFTLFGTKGKIDMVKIAGDFRQRSDEIPWSWSVDISSWNRDTTRVALAVSGSRENVPGVIQELPLDDARALIAVKAYLMTHHVNVERPRLTQVFRVDVDGDGQPETVISANSDIQAVKDSDRAGLYALTLLIVNVNGQDRTLPLRADAAYKPANRSLDEQQRLYGRLGTYQVLAFARLTQAPQVQIAVLYDNRYEGPEVDLFAYSGGKIAHLLETRKLHL